jgi:hypothetical protein
MGRSRQYIPIGTAYGKWTVLLICAEKPYEPTKYLCRCICGNERAVAAFTLKNGSSKQCTQCATKNWRRYCKNCEAQLEKI